MVVFYSDTGTGLGNRRIDVLTWLSESFLEQDISWWAVPGTLED